MNDIPEFEVRDEYVYDGTIVKVKPCRRCLERYSEIVKPKFYWFSDDINMISMYRIYCPKCDDRILNSGIVVEWNPNEAAEKWNDWSKSLRDWEEELDW